MPVNNVDSTADIQRSTGTQKIDREAILEDGSYEPDTDQHGSFYVGLSRTIPSASDTTTQGDSWGSRSHLGGSAQSGRPNSLLHIPSNSGVARVPVETPVWDWDTPLESVGESNSYYYEPQGELLQEHQQQQLARTEFSIPHAVETAGSNWTHSTPFDTSTVPKLLHVGTSVAGSKRKATFDNVTASAGRSSDQKRPSRVGMTVSSDDIPLSGEDHGGMDSARAGRASNMQPGGATGTEGQDAESEPLDGSSQRRTLENPSVPMVLPPRKVFPIQIGDKLFRLSGASISSDAPSYFSQFFEEQLRQNQGADSVRTLYIDRDPTTFEDIALHLQGYHIEPRDGPHFVRLFADAQFFSLPRLTAQLFSSTIYIRIGDEQFQIARDLFSSPGDSPNYFSLGFSIFFTTPTEVFPGLSQRTLLRPPSILPPSIPNRSAKTFADLLHFLKGYPVEIRSEEHRAELLRDARYFHLKGLEQRLLPHSISYNLARKRSEIVIRLEDIRQSGISFLADGAGQLAEGVSPAESATSSIQNGPGWICYQRPYVDSEAYSLIVELAGLESTYLSIAPATSSSPARVGRALFHNQTLSRITSLFSVIANKMNLPIMQPLGLMMMERGAGVASLPVSPGNTGVSEDRVKVRIGLDADVIVDGRKWFVGGSEEGDGDESGMDVDLSESTRKRKHNDMRDEGEDWVVKRAQWRLRVQPLTSGPQTGRSGMEVVLGAVKIEAYSNERARNAARGFLS